MLCAYNGHSEPRCQKACVADGATAKATEAECCCHVACASIGNHWTILELLLLMHLFLLKGGCLSEKFEVGETSFLQKPRWPRSIVWLPRDQDLKNTVFFATSKKFPTTLDGQNSDLEYFYMVFDEGNL